MKPEDTQYFSTQNRQLAFALATAGCRFAPPEAGGPTLNLYTVGFLRARGIGKGKLIEDAAAEAVQRKVPGAVTYLFHRDDLFARCIKAWDNMVDAFQAAEKAGRTPTLPAVTEEQIMQVCYIGAANQKSFAELPWVNPAMVSTVGSTTREEPIANKPGSRTITEGRGKVWTVGASKQLKEHLHV